MRKLWIWCFVATGIAYVFQLVPHTGVFLMIFAAPYWSVLLLNLGFIAMAVDGSREPSQPISFLLLLFPFLWFGGYAVMTVASHHQASQFDRNIAAANAGKTVNFDSQKQDILIERNRLLSADTFVRSYGLQEAYEVTEDGSGQVSKVALKDVQCPGKRGVGRSPDKSTTWNRPSDGGFGTDRPFVLARTGVCIFKSLSNPAHPTFRMRVGKESVERGLAILTTQKVEISTPNGEVLTLLSGSAVPFSWFPQPVLGCALNSAAASWDCLTGFRRESRYSATKDKSPNGPDNVAAMALRLTRASIRERYPDADWR